MVRRLRGFAATGCRQVFFLVLGAGLMWANFVTPAASEGYYDVIIKKSELDCEGTCTIADMPKVFAQACAVAGGTLLYGDKCKIANPPEGVGNEEFIALADEVYEVHLKEQAKAAAATASEISMNAIQAALRDIRDRLQDKASAAAKEKPQGLGARTS